MGSPSDSLIVLDQGTSATRAAAFDTHGRIVSFHTRAIRTERLRPGHAEMDHRRILRSVDQVLSLTLADIQHNGQKPAAMGLSVQRSSFLIWDDRHHRPLTPILSWQDTRAADVLPRFRDYADDIARITGLFLGPHYGGPKFAHLAAANPDLREAVKQPGVFFIPLESLLICHLTGKLRVDETIAGRTLLFDIHRRKWSDPLLELFGLPVSALPELVPSQSDYGTLHWQGYSIPLKVCLGDQQAALTGLGVHRSGDLAVNLGTSGSVALHTGDQPRPTPGLLANVACSTPGHVEYILEGTINAVGALFAWFEDELGIPDLYRSWPRLVAESTHLTLVPGLNGLAAPYWRTDVPTTFVPHQEGYPVAEQLRAGMESVAFLAADITDRMFKDRPEAGLGDIHVGGGMARPPLLQFLADLLQQPVHLHPETSGEATARGVVIRLAQTLGWDEFPSDPQRDQTFTPRITPAQRNAHRERWLEAVKQILER